ncbi:hypothetical protein BD414DRAFT_484757 [Trametes punicea]|nr:hypothetical protein BD414DRAFT_484757 [Trametes punicea]
MYETEETQEDLLSAYFEKSAAAVRHSFGRFERGLVRPTVRYVLESFQKYPIRSTFLATYATLSALPVLSFIGLSVFLFSSFIFFALCSAILAALSVVLFCGFWFACLLAFFLFLSIPITASILSTYILLRFAFIAKQESSVRSAVSQWAKETKGQFLKRDPGEKVDGDVQRESEGETLMVGSIVLDTLTPSGKAQNGAARELDALSAAESLRVEESS